MFTKRISCVVFVLLLRQIFCWEALPSIPSGHRAEFLVLQDDGAYKYGYDTGDGIAAKQSADSANQVTGHYFYKNPLGQNIDLKYTAGVQGFVPEGLEKLLPAPGPIPQLSPSNPTQPEDDQANTGDASYSFSFDTPTYRRIETSDPRGNVEGSFSYQNEAGRHDLIFNAGENTGFVARSGSLSKPNGIREPQPIVPLLRTAAVLPERPTSPVNQLNKDHSYIFSYSTDDSSREESADSANNVKGRYSYHNTAGTHDLSYIAGADTGFQVTGGSLATPNGLSGGTAPSALPDFQVTPPLQAVIKSSQSEDGSYSFSYSSADSSREESADSANNVQGRYSYKNTAGTHDLSYVAGANTGFQVTGGSLGIPNGLGQSNIPSLPIPSAQTTAITPEARLADGSQDDQSNTGDASYSFSIDTPDYNRQESSDSAGNVKGSFSYKNSVGTHDLSFVAGSQTGFQPISGSLSTPPGLNENQLRSGGNLQNSLVLPTLQQKSLMINGLIPVMPSTKNTVRLDKNVILHTYLPPNNDKGKFGYILNTI